MDSDGGSEVAVDTYMRSTAPFLAHQFFPGSKGRDTLSNGRQASFSSRLCLDSACSSPQALGSLERGPYGHTYNGRMNWDMKAWDWDSVLFLAQPNPQAPLVNDNHRSYENGDNGSRRYHQQNGGIVGSSASPEQNNSSDQEDPLPPERRRKHNLSYRENSLAPDNLQPFMRDGSSPEDDGESLSLKLGGHSYAYTDDDANGARSTKRYRSSSPPQFPVCQVDDCHADLSKAKDYHRRHKVCETHAKAGKALVTRLMQRFCQQCSRFHPLANFDEGKRSCRRRLAGHNRRRRKNQPEPVTARGYSTSEENGSTKVANLVGILNILNQFQAGVLNGAANDRTEVLMQYLKRTLSPLGLDSTALGNLLRMSGDGRRDLKAESTSNGSSHSSGESIEALLAAVAASAGTETLSLFVQSQLAAALLKAGEAPHGNVAAGNGSAAGAINGGRNLDKDVAGLPLSLSSQMASRPSEGHLASSSRPKSNSSFHPIILDESDHQNERYTDVQSRKVSPIQKLFPYTQDSEIRTNRMNLVDINRDDDGTTESTSDVDLQASFTTYMDGPESRNVQEVASHSRPYIDLQLPPPNNLSESSPSGSDQSPYSSSFANWQDRTGRISFKLFEKDPGELPQSLRKEILEWLAHRPSDMESHIRPGCVVLTIFLSMPKLAWQELERNLRTSLCKLTSTGTFWCKGRIHVQVERQNAFIVDGKVHVNKSKNSPQILSVRPFAVVAGQRSEIVISGTNLEHGGTRVYCAYQGKYVGSKGVQWSNAPSDTDSNDLWSNPQNGYSVEGQHRLSFGGGLPGIVGRCFVEAEKLAGGGNAVPIIVADESICDEIRSLEQEVETQGLLAGEGAKRDSCQPQEVSRFIRVARALAEVEVRCVLNELGWLFQRSQSLPSLDIPMLVPSRHRRLLVYAVERDWCAVVKKTLDITFAFGLVHGSNDRTFEAFKDVFQDEVSLLHRAVKRKCRPMVELLLGYIPCAVTDAAGGLTEKLVHCIHQKTLPNMAIFTPDMPGPQGFTPLHVAASMEGAEGVVDALTNDPNQIGLLAWSRVLNGLGETPAATAYAANKVSYIQLVRSKLAQREGQVPVTIPSTMRPRNNGIFGHYSSKDTNLQHGLELPLWSSLPLTQLEIAAPGRLRNPMRCNHSTRALHGPRGSLYRPFMVSMVAVAALCVCVCVVMRGPVMIRFILPPFSWNTLKFGSQ